jgi:ATP-dependent DNA helicase RecG
MKAADKEHEMNRFINHQTQYLVATTVIEVGVDIPNTSIMVMKVLTFELSQLPPGGVVWVEALSDHTVFCIQIRLSQDTHTNKDYG